MNNQTEKRIVYSQEVLMPGFQRGKVKFDDDLNLVDAGPNSDKPMMYPFKEALSELYFEVSELKDRDIRKAFFWNKVEPAIKPLKDEVEKTINEKRHAVSLVLREKHTLGNKLENLQSKLFQIGPLLIGLNFDNDLLS